MSALAAESPALGLGPRCSRELRRKVDELRQRARECRDLADSALSEEGKTTLSELALDFQSEANQIEQRLAEARSAVPADA